MPIGVRDGAISDAAQPMTDANPCAASAGDTIYVDSVLGSDDAAHGGGAGDCAVATIDYAISVASAEIRLAAGTYSRTETPIELSTGQSLVCEAGAVISGQGLNVSYNITIDLRNHDTSVAGCTITGAGLGGYCIDIQNQNLNNDNAIHTNSLSDNVISQCGGAAVRVAGLVDLELSGNTITASRASTPALFFQSSGSATIDNNTFVDGNWGIHCNQAGVQSGSGNTGTPCNLTACGTCPGY